MLAPCFLLSALACLSVTTGCTRTQPPRTAQPVASPCPEALVPQIPSGTTRWMFLRPRALFEHPRIGPLLARSLDADAQRALIGQAVRTGIDVRTLDRAVALWQPGSVVYFALGPLDGRTVTRRLWERMIAPRRRSRTPRADERLEGTLGAVRTAVLVRPACGAIGYTDAPRTTPLDRLMAPVPGTDPEALLLLRDVHPPESVQRAVGDRALFATVRSTELKLASATDGLDVRVRLDGALPTDAPVRLQRAARAFAQSPLGDLTAAVQWLTPERFVIVPDREGLTLSVRIPWRALEALAEVVRGNGAGDPVQ